MNSGLFVSDFTWYFPNYWPSFTVVGTAVPWESLLAFDVLVFLLIMYKAFKERGRLDIITDDNLFGLIVRDGKHIILVAAYLSIFLNTL